jgi:uncharacterized protein DUF4013
MSMATQSTSTRKIEYLEGFRILFKDPNWGINLLIGSVYMLIPILGPIVMMGWQMELFQRLCRRHPHPIPKQDFGDLPYYLGRGVIPFVVSLIICIPLVFVMVALIFSFIFGIGLLASQRVMTGPFIFLGFLGGGVTLFFLVMVPTITLANAALTRAYLTEDIGKAFELKKIFAYAQVTWKKILLAYLIYLPLTVVLMIAGMIALYVGMYPAMVIMNVAWLYIAWQIYENYLAEGGEAIEINPTAKPVPSELRLTSST